MRGAIKEVTISLVIFVALAWLGALLLLWMLPNKPTPGGIMFNIAELSLMVAFVVLSTAHPAHNIRMCLYLIRPPLSDRAFVALLPDPARIDLMSVQQARSMAAKHLKGARYYPTDRLEEDLHLFRRMPGWFPGIVGDLAESLGIDEDDMKSEFHSRELVTFGDLVQVVAECGRLAKLGWIKARAKPHPLWDRDLDA